MLLQQTLVISIAVWNCLMLIHNPKCSLQENNKSITLFYRLGVVRLSPSLAGRSDTVTEESSPELCPISTNSLNRFVMLTVYWYMSVHYVSFNVLFKNWNTSFISKKIYIWIIQILLNCIYFACKISHKLWLVP